MNRLISLIIAFICFLPALYAAPEYEVVASQINIYATPNPDSKVLRTLKKGDRIDWTGNFYGNMYETVVDNRIGYIIGHGLEYTLSGYERMETSAYDELVRQALQEQKTEYEFPVANFATKTNPKDFAEPIAREDIEDVPEQEVIGQVNEYDPMDDYAVRQPSFIQRALAVLIILLSLSIILLYLQIPSLKIIPWATPISLAILELIYFWLTPDPWFFSRLKELGDGSIVRTMNSGLPYLVAGLQLMSCFILIKNRRIDAGIKTCGIALTTAAFASALWLYGPVDFFTTMAGYLIQLAIGIIGMVIVGILIFGKDPDNRKGKTKNDDEEYESCIYYDCGLCKYHNRTGTYCRNRCGNFVRR